MIFFHLLQNLSDKELIKTLRFHSIVPLLYHQTQQSTSRICLATLRMNIIPGLYQKILTFNCPETESRNTIRNC